MRIAFVNNQFQCGGAETVVRQLHNGCRAAGHKSHLWLAEGKTYPWTGAIRPLYPRVLSFLHHTRLSSLVDRIAPRQQWTDQQFRLLAHNNSIDVVHVHNFHGLYASTKSLAYVAARKPVVWTFHRFWGITGGCDHPGQCKKYMVGCGECPKVDEWPLCGIDNTVESFQEKVRYLHSAPLRIVAPSRHLAKTVRESTIGKRWDVFHIANGINLEAFGYARKHDREFRCRLGVAHDKAIVLIANRDFEDTLKGFDLISKALDAVSPEGLQIVLAGGRSAWASTILKKRFDCVDMGYVSDRLRMSMLYEVADILLYASPGENFPCVILEAMSAECCIVSTPTDGVLEQVTHQEDGLLARTFNPFDLAAELQAICRDPDRLRELGKAARVKVERLFTENEMVSRHLELYDRVIRMGT